MTGALIVSRCPDLLPAWLFAPTPKAAQRVLEFFTAQINNDHTPQTYLNAAPLLVRATRLEIGIDLGES